MGRQNKRVYYDGVYGTAIVEDDGGVYVESDDELIYCWPGSWEQVDSAFKQAVKDYKANPSQDTGTGFYWED